MQPVKNNLDKALKEYQHELPKEKIALIKRASDALWRWLQRMDQNETS